MVRMQFTDNQTAFKYVIYMIVGSYFQKTRCVNILYEKKMHFQYCEQKRNNQYLMEEICINYVENVMFQKLPQDLWKNDVIVKLDFHENDEKMEICFVSSQYILRMKGTYRGKNSKLSYELLSKKEDDVLSNACVSGEHGRRKRC